MSLSSRHEIKSPDFSLMLGFTHRTTRFLISEDCRFHIIKNLVNFTVHKISLRIINEER
jgi:hypothetical protein